LIQIHNIYILLSIKTRIETLGSNRNDNAPNDIYILLSIKTRIETRNFWFSTHYQFQFISYYPLKQGLKLMKSGRLSLSANIYILLSIKTRIETKEDKMAQFNMTQFISYYPLKQGLKLERGVATSDVPLHLYPTIH